MHSRRIPHLTPLLYLNLIFCEQSDVLDVMRSTVGSKFRSALDEALSVKYDAFGQRERNIVLTAIKELRINKDMAKEMLAVSTKNLFLQYITASRLKQNRLDAAKELKRMVFFSNIVIAPLLEDIKGAQVDLTETMKQFSETLAKASKEVEDEGDKPLPTAAEEVAAQPEGHVFFLKHVMLSGIGLSRIDAQYFEQSDESKRSVRDGRRQRGLLRCSHVLSKRDHAER